MFQEIKSKVLLENQSIDDKFDQNKNRADDEVDWVNFRPLPSKRGTQSTLQHVESMKTIQPFPNSFSRNHVKIENTVKASFGRSSSLLDNLKL